MSYQVIARKWRPKHFDQLVGQTHVSQTLVNALKNDRLHHALLFTGPRGTGKTSTARILAKALRCPDDPEGTSQEAQDIAAGRSVDVIEIDGASNNGVDAIRELRETVGYMPSSGSHKVYIIDEVHMLSTAAFNALLKTLEEPPDHVVFIMATTEVQKIPNTILSRCQRFDFRRISIQLIADHLAEICKSDGVDASQEALWAIARQGDGSMRDAQSLLDQVITFSGQAFTLEQVTDILGLTDRALLNEILQSLVTRDSQAALTVIEKLFQSGYDPLVFSQDFLEQIRNALIVKTSGQQAQSILDIPSTEAEWLKEVLEPLSEADIHMLFDMMLKGFNDIARSPDPRVVLEMVMLRMASAPWVVDIASLPTTLEKKKQSQPQKPSTKTSAPPVTAEKPAPPRPQPIRQPEPTGFDPKLSAEKNWFQLVQKIKAANGLVGAQLENTFLTEVRDNTLFIGVPGALKFLYEKLNSPEFVDKILNYVRTFWGGEYQIKIVMDSAEDEDRTLTPKQALEKQKQDKENKARASVEAHPFYQSVNQLFETEIKSIKETKS